MNTFVNQASRDPEILEALRNIEAWGLSPRFNKTSIAIFAQNGLLLIELRNKPQILFFAKEMGIISKPDPSDPVPIEPTCTTIARLESELASERALRLKISADRDTLERRLKERRSTTASDERYAKLNKFLAKELHPDYCLGTELERKFRSDFFKIMWSKIEEIDKS